MGCGHSIARVLLFLQDDINLAQVLRSFNPLGGQLEFSFEELFKATTMHKTVSQLWGETFHRYFDSCVSSTLIVSYCGCNFLAVH